MLIVSAHTYCTHNVYVTISCKVSERIDTTAGTLDETSPVFNSLRLLHGDPYLTYSFKVKRSLSYLSLYFLQKRKYLCLRSSAFTADVPLNCTHILAVLVLNG